MSSSHSSQNFAKKGSSASLSPLQQQQYQQQQRGSTSPNENYQYNLHQTQQQQQQQQRELTYYNQMNSGPSDSSRVGGPSGSSLYTTQRITTFHSPEYNTATYLNAPSYRSTSRGETTAVHQPNDNETIIRRGEIVTPTSFAATTRDSSSHGERVIRWSSVERGTASPSDYQVVQPIVANQEVNFGRAGSREGRNCSESVTTLDGGDSLTLVILNCSPNPGDSVCTSARASSSRASDQSHLNYCSCQTELTIRHELIPIDHSVCQQHQHYNQHLASNRPATITEIEEVTTSEETERRHRDQRHTQHDHYQQWLSDQNRSRNDDDPQRYQQQQPIIRHEYQQQNYQQPRPQQQQQQQQQQTRSQLTFEQIEQSYEEQMREFENQIQQSYLTSPQRQYTTTHHRETQQTNQEQQPQQQQRRHQEYQETKSYDSRHQEDPVFQMQTKQSLQPNSPQQARQSPREEQQLPAISPANPEQTSSPTQQDNDPQTTTTSATTLTTTATTTSTSGTRLVKRWDFNQQQFVMTEVPDQKWRQPPPPSQRAPNKEPEPVWTQHRVPDIESVQSDPLYSDLMLELQQLEEGVQVKPEQVIVEPETFQKPIFGQKILPEHVEVNEYENVEFVCRLIPISDPQMKIEWTVNGRPLSEGSRYLSEYEFGVVKLRIKRCEAEDSGIYQCKATNAMGEALATASLRVHAKGLVQCETLNPAGLDKIRQLENPKPVEHVEEQVVQQPPKFLTHIQDYVEKEEGESVHFECCLGPVEDPDLKTEWFFNGRPLVTGSRFHTIDDFGFIVLDIDWLFPRDTGEYVCRATNKYGSDITRTVLRVKPVKNIVLDSQLDNSDQIIDKLRRLEFPDVEQEVHVEEPDKPAHFVVPLRSEGNKRQFVEGDNVHFEARVGPATDGNLTVEWYHNDKPLISGHRFKPTFDFGHIQLDILYVYAEDTGVYKCVAKNATGTDVSQFEIHVTGKPSLVYQSQLPKEMEGGVQKITEMEAMWNRAPDPEEEEAPAERMAPQFVLKPKPYTAFEGSCARFCCRVIGNPRPRLTWTLNGQSVVTGSRHKLTYDGMYHLTIPKCQLNDAGKVEVHARNLLGECYCATELNVKRKVDDYRGVLKNSPNPWYDEQSLKVYQRQRSQDLTDDEDFSTFQANRLQLITEQGGLGGNQLVGYMEPDTPDVNLLAQSRAPLIEPGDLHPVVIDRQVVMAPAPSTVQKAFHVKDSIKPPEPVQLPIPQKRKQLQQLNLYEKDQGTGEDQEPMDQLSASQMKSSEHVFGLDLPRYLPQPSTSGLQSPAIDTYRSKNLQQDYWSQQKIQQEQHAERQNQMKLQHQQQQKLEQQQQMAQHQQYQREKQVMRERQQVRQQQKLQEQLERQQQEKQHQQEMQQLQQIREQQQLLLQKQKQHEQQQQQQLFIQQQQQQQQQQLLMQQQQQADERLSQDREQQGSRQQVFDPRLPPPSPESKVHGKEVHFHTHKQTQKERRGANRVIVREIIDKEIFEQEHTGMTKDNVVRGSSAERGSTPDTSSSSQTREQQQRQVYYERQQQQQQSKLRQQRQVRFQEEQEEELVLVEEYMIPPEFIQKIQPCRAIDGSEARFECTYIGDPKPTITWFRESKVIKPSNLYVVTTDSEECNSSLVIRRVTLNANAVYTVKAENVAGSAKSSANLVVEPVSLGHQGQLEGSAISSGRSVSASPTGSRSSSAGGGGFLASSSSQQQQKSTVTSATTTGGSNISLSGDLSSSSYAAGSMSDDQSSDSQKVVKSIKTRKLSADQMASLIRATSESTLVPPTFLHTIHDIQSRPGELVRLDARLIGTQPMEVRWAKDGERLRADRSHKMVLEGDLYTLLILECSQHDEGLYECLACNQVGEAKCEARLTVADHEVRRSASAMGSRSPDDPSSSVAFRSHSATGGSISPSSVISSSATYSSATTAAAESSQMSASGAAMGQKRHYGLQKHSYSPLMTQYTNQSGSSSSQQEIIPRLIKRLENQQVKEGKSVTLRCQISSFPIVEVHWYKQGNKLIKPSKYFRIFKDNDETYCLKILETFPEDQDEYKCVAQTPNGQTQVETKATITVIPNSPR